MGLIDGDERASEFPVWGLLPKKETGVKSFLDKYPEYDGRGTVIAIFDSGVDPGAPGLCKTSEGKPKVIDRVDCSGAGDVDMTTVVEAKDGVITGLTGRKLKVPSSWSNPSGKFHIGAKEAAFLYPAKVLDRWTSERREKHFDPAHRQTVADVHGRIQFIDKNDEKQKDNREELEGQLEVLQTLEKNYQDLGPVFDCVVFNDGKTWLACVDTSEEGDLESCALMASYRERFEFTHFCSESRLNFSVNIYDEGNLLEIVALASSHGTHVASIASAYFPEEPSKNGVAPGAQIVSVAIGDNRLEAMETGTALARAMIHVMNSDHYKVDVINMSYGEHADWANAGRLSEYVSEVVHDAGIVWLASAGNSGPALSTVGAPPDIKDPCILGVGAYVFPEMMAASYSMREKNPTMPYTFTSRGPTVDGARGVSIVAPGGAVTSVPTFTHKDSQLMHGTSMASPHAAGCIALMISSARQMDFPFSPYSVRRAIENAAFKVPELDIFAQGHGLIQMEPAVNLLKELSNSPDRDVNYNVTINSHQKGIHLRGNYGELKRPREFTVSVEPKFFKSKKLDPEQKLAFHARFVLINDASWIQCPDHVDMSYGVKTFSVRIDPKNIPSTGPHLHFIQAYHVGQIQLGPVWEIPVAVMVPEPPSSPVEPRSSLVSLRGGGPIPAPAVCDHKFVSTQMKGGDVFRKFLTVPTGAAWAVVKVTVSNLEKSCRYLLHTVQLSPEKSCRTNEHHKWLSFGQDGNYKTSFPVVPELALEVCLAKNWSSHGVSDVTLELTFHGYVTSEGSSQLTFLGSQGVKKVDLLCTLRPMEMMPSIVFKHLVAVLRPQESRVVPLPLPRDLRSEGRRNYMLMLKYQFHLTRTTEVRPISPLLSGYLYESEFEAQLIIIQDAHRRIHLVADAYPFKYSKKLDKGEYIVLQYIRHDKLKLLESMADIPLHIEQKLGSSISLDCYPSWTAAVSEGKKILPRSLQTGDCVPVYISTHVTDKTYKNATAGSFLTGTVSWVKDEPGKKASSYPATMVVPEPPNYKKNSNTSPTRSSGKCPPTGKEKEKDGTDSGAEDGGCGPLPKGESSASLSTAASSSDVKCPPPTAAPGKKKSKEEEFAEAERDLRVAWIYKLDPKGKGKELYEELDSKWSAHVPLHLARMNALDTADDKTGALEMANKVISLIDETKLLMFFGHKTLPADMAKNKSAMERERGWLCEALAKKGTILLQQGTDREEVERVWTTLLKFVDCHGQTVVNFTVAYCTEKGWYSKAIRAIQKQMTEKNSIALEEKLEKVFELVGWVHLQRLTQRNKLVKFPNWRHLP